LSQRPRTAIAATPSGALEREDLTVEHYVPADVAVAA
jgi:hypothetical protein